MKYSVGDLLKVTVGGNWATGVGGGHQFPVGTIIRIIKVRPDGYNCEFAYVGDDSTTWYVDDDCTELYRENFVTDVRYAKQVRIKSSRGINSYTVSLTKEGELQCSCLAWTRRRIHCRHIKEAIKTYGPNLDSLSNPSDEELATKANSWMDTQVARVVEPELTPLERIATGAKFRRV